MSDQASVELATGIPFLSDAALESALDGCGRQRRDRRRRVDENTQARLDGLRAALAVLALIALAGLFFTGRIPTVQPGSTPVAAEA